MNADVACINTLLNRQASDLRAALVSALAGRITLLPTHPMVSSKATSVCLFPLILPCPEPHQLISHSPMPVMPAITPPTDPAADPSSITRWLSLSRKNLTMRLPTAAQPQLRDLTSPLSAGVSAATSADGAV